jgi:hypothetical protein
MATLTAGLLVVLPATAGARNVGADLARPANVGFGCESLPIADPFGARAFLPKNAASCTYLGSGSRFASREVPGAPAGGGTVTRVRIKVGARTGPMQIVVLRATRSAVGFACCFYVRASRVFTPATNRVNRLNTNLRVRNDLNRSFGETRDYLGISVLAPGVPIPAHDTGAPGDSTGPVATAFFPLVKPGDERVDGAGITGVTPLINATVRRRR